MKNNSVLVTGGAGFIGSHLVKRLVASGAKVSVIVKYNSIIDNIRLSSIWEDIQVYEADLRNIDSLRQFKDTTFDQVFHLAAYNHVGDSFLHYNEALQSNAIATANLMEFIPSFGRFLYMSSSEVYGYQRIVPFQEDSLPNPISPYAIGKYAGELFAKMKRIQTGASIVCVRAFNTFGPYQSERAVIPELIIKCLRGNTVKTTLGLQTREFNYVDNILDGLITAIESKPVLDGVINFGSNKEISIAELAKKIHSLTNSKSQLEIGALEERPTEIPRMSADSSKAKEKLMWVPKVLFLDGLRKTVDWYRNYIKLYYEDSSVLNQL